MGIPVLVYGKSGSGKSRSLKNFSPDELVLINPIGKPLPFRGKFKWTLISDSYADIKNWLANMPVDTAVIDDAGYLLTNHFMRSHSGPKGGGNTFDLFNAIADEFWSLMSFIQYQLPQNKVVYIIMHEQADDYGNTKLRTIGKLLDEKVCIEGMVTICLHCLADKDHHYFRTNSDGGDICKSPEDLFPLEIENDLKAVDTAIREYWGITPEPAQEAPNGQT